MSLAGGWGGADWGGGVSSHLPASNQDQMPPASTSNCPPIKTHHFQIRKKNVISFSEFKVEGPRRACQQGLRVLG
jgi:hypothetical protein